MHHAGMLRGDRNLVEKFFADGVLKVTLSPRPSSPVLQTVACFALVCDYSKAVAPCLASRFSHV